LIKQKQGIFAKKN